MRYMESPTTKAECERLGGGKRLEAEIGARLQVIVSRWKMKQSLKYYGERRTGPQGRREGDGMCLVSKFYCQ